MKAITNFFKVLVILLNLLIITVSCSNNETKQFSSIEFANPSDNVKIHTWWHWLDGNITKEGITKDLEAMKEQGIVQATILNIGLFGDKDFGIKKVNFNTPEWYEMFEWALKEANRLGITIGTQNCDGWSTSGGPWITPEMSMKEFTWTKTIVSASQKSAVKLKQPLAIRDYYQDVAVVAIKSDHPQSTFQKASPNALLNGSKNADCIFDGCPASEIEFARGDQITFEFSAPFMAEKISILPRRRFMWSSPEDFTTTCLISSSDDGINFTKIKEFTINGLNKMALVPFEKTTAKFFRLSLLNANRQDNLVPFSIAECELLSESESPLYSPETEFLLEKTGSVKAANEAVFYSQATASNNKIKEVIDITSQMSKDGTLNWKPTEGDWTIIRFGYTTTGSLNAPATPAGTGLECDKMDTSALNLHFKSFPAKLIERAGPFTGNTFKFMLIDSWEAGYQNWTKNMVKEFEQQQGYSLISYIPVLCGESSGNKEIDEAFLFDFRSTIAALIETNYYKHFSKLLHRNNMELHAEVIYGNVNYPPLDILKTTQYVDVPMFEFWSSTNRENRIAYYPSDGIELNMPSCAAINYEKPIVAAEAYTGMAHYSETPAGLKPFGDKAFCSGINQMILHSYVHQPDDRKPGMTLGQWASHFNRNNLYWPYLSEWINYQSRIQYVLQKGVAIEDVLYYLGDQLPQNLRYNKSNKLPFGYLFNACNYDVLKNRIKVADGKLVLNSKSSYSVLCLSPFETLSFESLKRIEELVREGVILYGPMPQRMLSLHDIRNNKDEFEELKTRIWGKIDGNSITSNKCGKGRVYWGISLDEVLKIEKIVPDLYTQQKDSSTLLFIHKLIDGTDVYFIMNQQNHEVRRDISFRVTGKTPEIWDPECGSIIKPAVFAINDMYTTLPVNLKPYQSLLFVFRNENPANYIQSVNQKGEKIFPAKDFSKLHVVPYIINEGDSFVAASKAEGEYELMSNNQKKFIIKSSPVKEYVLTDYSGIISFQPGYSAKFQPVKFTKLQWLTESENPDIKYFSGTANYSVAFKYPADMIQESDSVLLDLGDFGSVANVSLNGINLGSVWKTGIFIPVKGILKAENVLEVTIANTYRNRLIGDFVQSGDVQDLWTSAPISDFLKKDYSLEPSGLKGPLRIITLEKQIINK